LDVADLRQKMLSSSAWVALSGGANQAVSFIIFVVIARLVTPAQFGLVALAALLIELMQIVSTAGIADAVIQRPALDERAADTAFWLNLLGGILVAVLALALAGPLGALFGVAGLGRAISLLALTFVMAPIGNIHAARLQREFGFKALAIRNVVANLISGGVGIWIALAGGGADALIAQRLTAAAAISAIGFLSYRWLPELRFDMAACRELASFALKIVSSQILLMVNVRSIDLIAGFLMGPVAVATIRVANRCIDMLMNLTVMPFQQVALPVLSRAQHDPAARRSAYISLSRLSALVIYPAFAGAFALAPMLVPAVFGPQWREAGVVMQLICFAAIPLHFNVLLPATLAAAGHPGQVLGWSAAQLIIGVAACIFGARYGLIGLVGANLFRAYVLLPLGLVLMQRNSGIGPDVVLTSIARPFAASALMALTAWLVQSSVSPVLPVWAVLACGIAVGALSYAVFILLLMGDLLPGASSMLPARMRPAMAALLQCVPARLLESKNAA
jgi:O-antigen/teichoic acid export membrane protein